MTSVGRQALARPRAIRRRRVPKIDRPVFERVVGLQHQHEFLAEIGADRAFVDEDGVVAVAATSLMRANKPGREAPVLVVEHGARADRAAARVDLVVEEVEMPLMRIALLRRPGP